MVGTYLFVIECVSIIGPSFGCVRALCSLRFKNRYDEHLLFSNTSTLMIACCLFLSQIRTWNLLLRHCRRLGNCLFLSHLSIDLVRRKMPGFFRANCLPLSHTNWAWFLCIFNTFPDLGYVVPHMRNNAGAPTMTQVTIANFSSVSLESENCLLFPM